MRLLTSSDAVGQRAGILTGGVSVADSGDAALQAGLAPSRDDPRWTSVRRLLGASPAARRPLQSHADRLREGEQVYPRRCHT